MRTLQKQPSFISASKNVALVYQDEQILLFYLQLE